ncbi:MAG TPA: zinc ribbon domain-containing protein, partial [Candidatus Sulfotelmatobacter sp.]|nr:zinc ribbon domain-containing protein [Candidatus Sulfotelmatobacter sp.]
KNSSIIYKLFQGYRRIEGGPRFLYPGYWSMKDGAHTFKPLSKDDAEEFYEKFKNNEAGYGPDDDSKWFEMVEKAQERPDTGMKKCPNPECLMDNPEDDETCFNCGFIFNKKQCISCKQDIPFSAERCGLCGADQDENSSKWTCQICLKENNNDSSECSSCGSLKGTINTLSLEYLVSHSQIIKELSIDNAFIKLPDDAFSSPLNIEVRSLNSEGKHLILKNKRLPIFVDRTAEKITVIVDHEHPAFVKFQDRIEDYVAIEIANSIKQRLTSSPNKEDLQLWNLANIYYLIQSTLWPDQIEFDPQVLKEEVKSFFNDLSSAMPKLMQGVGRDIYNSLDKKSQAKLAMEIAKNTDLGKLDELIDKNLIFNYFDNGMILQLIKDNPNYFFDNKYWQDSYISIDMGDDEINSQIRKSILAKYINCLENLTIYLDLRNPSPIDAKRAELALLLAKQKINN